MTYITKSAWHLVVHLVGTGDIVLILAGQTNSATILDLPCQPLEAGHFCGAIVERHNGPSWLRDDDDDESLCQFTCRLTSRNCICECYKFCTRYGSDHFVCV